MSRHLAYVALLVRDYDDAIAFFTAKLGWVLLEDAPVTPSKRWVRVAPSAGSESGLLLARAAGAEQEAAVGRQGGGRVFGFVHTDDFGADHRAMLDRGIEFEEPPRQEPYGTVAVFRDLYGNRWDLIEPRTPEVP